MFYRCLSAATDRATLAGHLPSLLHQALTQHALTHRIWYHIRAQAMFDQTFVELVSNLEDRFIKVIQHGLRRLSAADAMRGQSTPQHAAFDATLIYITLDGWFRFYLQRFMMGHEKAARLLKQRLLDMFQHGFKHGAVATNQ